MLHSLRRRIVGCVGSAALAIVSGTMVVAAEPSATAAPDFNRDVRPILSQHCFKCHGPDEKTREAELRFDVRAAALAETVSGVRPIVPQQPDASELIHRIESSDPDLLMPPAAANKPLSDAQKKVLRDWIAAGAPYAEHWAFVPPVRGALPVVQNSAWPRNAIDNFILARLEAEGLSPAPEADRHTLVRRVFLDLIGLPPTPAEVDAYVDDASPDAYEKLVDRLLASPHYGERWARRWLDLARYADTNGYEKDRVRSIWPYRDWVINALNADLPFDQFTIQQLAGDLLPNAGLAERIATGFHRNTMLNEEGGIDPLEFRFYSMVDRVNTTATVWMGLTLGCAQCHTHKYDPLTQTDYYRTLALLNNADEPEVDVPSETIAAQQAEVDRQIAALEADLPNRFPAEGEYRWHDAQVVSIATAGESTATLQPDGAVLLSGTNPAEDTYTVVIESALPRVAAIQIEALTDASLGHSGPGRTPHGNFVLTELALTATPPGAGQADAALKFARADADFSQEGFPPQHAIDGQGKTGWAIHGSGEWNVPRRATFYLEQPQAAVPGTRWTVRLEQNYGGQHTLGRFRIRLGEPLDDSRPLPERQAAHRDRRFGEWLQAESQRTGQWELLQPVAATSKIPTLAILPDDSVLASGDMSKRDEYFVTYTSPLRGVTAIRLEVLPDERLPKNGPGRIAYEGPFGDFFLSELTVKQGGAAVPLAGASHSFAGSGSAAAAIDGDPQTGWSINGGQGRAHHAVFRFQEPLASVEALELTLLFERYYAAGLGRFRVWATTDASPAAARDLPTEVDPLLRKSVEARSAEDRAQLLQHFLLRAPEMSAAVAELKKLRDSRPQFPTTLVLEERPASNPRATHIHRRGEYLQTTEVVTPEVPAVFPPLAAASGHDRLAFARWLVSPANPLAARVTMNRQWGAIFGRGLVRTTEDFGYQGETPTHPELLDWLAVEFVERGWSLKQMHKLLVTSATYRQSSRATPELLAHDPQNKLLARGPRVRLDAELVRDAVLRASGLLSPKLGGPSVFPPQPPGVTSEGTYGPLSWKVSEGEDRYRRGLYTFAKRTAPYAMFTAFDAPSGEACLARREVSNTPLQALTLLNDAVFVEAAQKLGQDLATAAGDENERSVSLFRRCTSRPPQDDERQLIVEFFNVQLARLAAGELDARAITGRTDAELNDALRAQAAWTLTARAVLNLDEVITKE
ncbi:MAG: PSD1 domain-containing protein [Planctomycetaceae bacterium]|nr:PSD1 domain-containing protein [Planctomycetaceae bacterium]